MSSTAYKRNFLIIITKLFKIIIIILLAFYNILIVKPILKSKGIC